MPKAPWLKVLRSRAPFLWKGIPPENFNASSPTTNDDAHAKPFDSWSPYAEEYYYLVQPASSSACYEYVKETAEEIAIQSDQIVNVVDAREGICEVWVEVRRTMLPQSFIDIPVANGLTLNFTVEPGSSVDTIEKACQRLLITEYFCDVRDRVVELRARRRYARKPKLLTTKPNARKFRRVDEKRYMYTQRNAFL